MVIPKDLDLADVIQTLELLASVVVLNHKLFHATTEHTIMHIKYAIEESECTLKQNL